MSTVRGLPLTPRRRHDSIGVRFTFVPEAGVKGSRPLVSRPADALSAVLRGPQLPAHWSHGQRCLRPSANRPPLASRGKPHLAERPPPRPRGAGVFEASGRQVLRRSATGGHGTQKTPVTRPGSLFWRRGGLLFLFVEPAAASLPDFLQDDERPRVRVDIDIWPTSAILVQTLAGHAEQVLRLLGGQGGCRDRVCHATSIARRGSGVKRGKEGMLNFLHACKNS